MPLWAAAEPLHVPPPEAGIARLRRCASERQPRGRSPCGGDAGGRPYGGWTLLWLARVLIFRIVTPPDTTVGPNTLPAMAAAPFRLRIP